jgi:hypothetical protein
MNRGNEKIKLSATYVNGIAIAIAAIGSLGPLAAFSYSDQQSLGHFGIVLAIGVLWVIASYIMHRWARFLLEDLEDE